jgi:hypothetical protein
MSGARLCAFSSLIQVTTDSSCKITSKCSLVASTHERKLCSLSSVWVLLAQEPQVYVAFTASSSSSSSIFVLAWRNRWRDGGQRWYEKINFNDFTPWKTQRRVKWGAKTIISSIVNYPVKYLTLANHESHVWKLTSKLQHILGGCHAGEAKVESPRNRLILKSVTGIFIGKGRKRNAMMQEQGLGQKAPDLPFETKVTRKRDPKTVCSIRRPENQTTRKKATRKKSTTRKNQTIRRPENRWPENRVLHQTFVISNTRPPVHQQQFLALMPYSPISSLRNNVGQGPGRICRATRRRPPVETRNCVSGKEQC